MSTGKETTLLAKFRRNEKGNFMMIFAFATAVIFMCVGLAVEYSQSINIKTRVTNALDAATLATARAISIGDITEAEGPAYLEDVFIANIGIDALDGSRYSINNITINTISQTVSAEASYDQDLDFISVGKHTGSQDVGSLSAATYGLADVEVAMILDTTGSMGGSKIAALEDAAELGVTELLKVNSPGDEKLRISVIPYAYGVNAGPLAKYVYADFQTKKINAPAFDQNLYDTTGVGYDIAAFQELGNMNHMLANADGTPIDNCSTDRKKPTSGANHQIGDAPPTDGMISRDSRMKESYCPSAELVPLTSDSTALLAAVSDLPASGYTAGHIGLQWAYYTISHEWFDFLPTGSKPGDHHDPDEEIAKYIILMTDGIFNTAYADVRRKDWSPGRQANTSFNFAQKLCTEIKNDDIKIFTIGFQMNQQSALDMLKNCATPDQGDITFHYEPNTAAELKETYALIASTIQSLLLIQ